MSDKIVRLAKRQEDLRGGKPDFFVYAGSQLVGRIYQNHLTGIIRNLVLGYQWATVDVTIGAGHAGSCLGPR